MLVVHSMFLWYSNKNRHSNNNHQHYLHPPSSLCCCIITLYLSPSLLQCMPFFCAQEKALDCLLILEILLLFIIVPSYAILLQRRWIIGEKILSGLIHSVMLCIYWSHLFLFGVLNSLQTVICMWD